MIRTPIIHDRHLVKSYFEEMKSNNTYRGEFECPGNLTIITCRNEGSMEDRIIPSLEGFEDKSILESNLEYLGIRGLVVLRDKRLPWRNTYKIENIYNYLISGKCTTKYFMYCDAIDVIFKDDPKVVIDIFESFKCKMLFMSTQSTDGYNCMPEVKAWADKINPNRYMNSGVYIGYTDFVTSFFKEAIKYITPHGCLMAEYRDYLSTTPSNYPAGSQDQDIFRYIQPKFYPDLQVDYKNLMAYRS
jgi:hypothetical protein